MSDAVAQAIATIRQIPADALGIRHVTRQSSTAFCNLGDVGIFGTGKRVKLRRGREITMTANSGGECSVAQCRLLLERGR